MLLSLFCPRSFRHRATNIPRPVVFIFSFVYIFLTTIASFLLISLFSLKATRDTSTIFVACESCLILLCAPPTTHRAERLALEEINSNRRKKRGPRRSLDPFSTCAYFIEFYLEKPRPYDDAESIVCRPLQKTENHPPSPIPTPETKRDTVNRPLRPKTPRRKPRSSRAANPRVPKKHQGHIGHSATHTPYSYLRNAHPTLAIQPTHSRIPATQIRLVPLLIDCVLKFSSGHIQLFLLLFLRPPPSLLRAITIIFLFDRINQLSALLAGFLPSLLSLSLFPRF